MKIKFLLFLFTLSIATKLSSSFDEGKLLNALSNLDTNKTSDKSTKSKAPPENNDYDTEDNVFEDKTPNVKDWNEVRLYSSYPFSNTLDNIDYISFGYNAAYANPKPIEGKIDPGFRANPIFELVYNPNRVCGDTRYQVPEGLYYRKIKGCAIDENSKDFTTTKSYRKELSVDTSISGNSASKLFAFSASTGYKNVKESTTKKKSVFIEKSGRCSMYQVAIDYVNPPKFTDSFQKAVEKLGQKVIEDYDDTNIMDKYKDYFEFFEEYGTNVQKKLELGSKYGILSELTQTEYTEMKSNSKSGKISLSFTPPTPPVETKDEEDKDKDKDKKEEKACCCPSKAEEEEKKKISGGIGFGLSVSNKNGDKKALSKTKQYSIGASIPADMNMNTWAQNTESEPMPIKLDLSDISILFDKNKKFYHNFDKVSDKTKLDEIGKNIDSALREYPNYLFLMNKIDSKNINEEEDKEANRCIKIYDKKDYTGQKLEVCDNFPDFTNQLEVYSINSLENSYIYLFSQINYLGEYRKLYRGNLETIGMEGTVKSLIVMPEKCVEVTLKSIFSTQHQIICDNIRDVDKIYGYNKIIAEDIIFLNEMNMIDTQIIIFDEPDYKGKKTTIRQYSEKKELGKIYFASCQISFVERTVKERLQLGLRKTILNNYDKAKLNNNDLVKRYVRKVAKKISKKM